MSTLALIQAAIAALQAAQEGLQKAQEAAQTPEVAPTTQPARSAAPTGRICSSTPNLQQIHRDSPEARALSKAYSGLQAHSVGAQYPFTVVGYEAEDGLRYGVQNLLIGKWAAYPIGSYNKGRCWFDARGATSFIDKYCVNREFDKYDDQGDEITWVSR